MAIVILLIILAVILIIVVVAKQREAQEAATETVNRSMSANNFNATKTVIVGDAKLYIDDNNKKWFVQKTAIDTNMKIYNYSDLIEFEIFQDGGSIAKGTTKGKVQGKKGSAIVGGVLFGPIGAVIGASGSRKVKSTTTTVTKNVCNTLQVRIQVNDINSPEIVIPIINQPTETDSSIYNLLLSSAKTCAATLAYIQTGSEEPTPQEDNEPTNTDELEKLFKLKEQGIITQDEFEQKKKQILGL